MQSKLLGLLLKATELTNEHQNQPKSFKKQHNKTYFSPHKKAKLQHKINLRQDSVCSDQNIYPNPDKFYMSIARTARNI